MRRVEKSTSEHCELEEKASKIKGHYMGVLINIDNEYCEPEIDSIMEFLDNEKKGRNKL